MAKQHIPGPLAFPRALPINLGGLAAGDPLARLVGALGLLRGIVRQL